MRWIFYTFTMISLAYAANVIVLGSSCLFHFADWFWASDMFINLRWADSILAQGWLNPSPYHPYEHVDWMIQLGTPEEFARWWGNPAIYQQSPLYAYFLALAELMFEDLIYVHLIQALLAVMLCGLIGWIGYRISGQFWVGWIAGVVAGGYAPFYAYSWHLLRDIMAWTLCAGLLAVLLEGDCQTAQSRKRLCSGLTGILLGIGFLLRETFMFIIPAVWGVLFLRTLRSRDWKGYVLLVSGTLVCLSPLAVRNGLVGAPLLSSSNRFADFFILGNARSAHPYLFIIPTEMRQIMVESDGKPWEVVKATLRTHPSLMSWLKHQGNKILSLMDPFESMDNVNIEHMALFSPCIRWDSNTGW